MSEAVVGAHDERNVLTKTAEKSPEFFIQKFKQRLSLHISEAQGQSQAIDKTEIQHRAVPIAIVQQTLNNTKTSLNAIAQHLNVG